MRFTGKFERQLTAKTTDICIEGFPRSANTYAVAVFQAANTDKTISHHVHVPMQVTRAVKLGIPTLVLIRDPANAIASLLVADSSLSIYLALWTYISFYKNVMKHRDSYVLADFEEVITCFPDVLDRINKTTKDKFNMPEVSESFEQSIFESIDHHHIKSAAPEHLLPRPSEEKSKLKQDVLESVRRHRLFPSALDIYNRMHSL